jgi:ubiquinone/menaquinone biosynthesis C-methylase UbiE
MVVTTFPSAASRHLMRALLHFHFLPFALLVAATGCNPGPSTSVALVDADTVYKTQPNRSADGTGRFYMGREIAPMVSHQSVGWLERSEREQQERTDLLLKELTLETNDVVADIGAGSGYFTFRLAPLVPNGTVLAVDVQPRMLDIIQDSAKRKGIQNVQTILGEEDDPKLADGAVDLVLLVDAYHEFSHPFEMMTGVRRALKTGGRVALFEFRGEDPDVPIKPLHKMTEAQAKKEMLAVGLEWIETRAVLPQQHLMFFGKP